MSASDFLAIGIDVGGTKIAAGLIAFPEGRVLDQRLTPTDAGRGGRPVLDDALRLARELAVRPGALMPSVWACANWWTATAG
jgi:predicted NBD/HSP70 family sugar kinase